MLHIDKTNSSLIDTTPVVPYCRVLTRALYIHTAWGAFHGVWYRKKGQDQETTRKPSPAVSECAVRCDQSPFALPHSRSGDKMAEKWRKTRVQSIPFGPSESSTKCRSSQALPTRSDSRSGRVVDAGTRAILQCVTSRAPVGLSVELNRRVCMLVCRPEQDFRVSA